jgi:VanZ family protein
MFILTHLPPSRVPKLRMSDKIEHLMAFMLLGGLLYLCLRPRVRQTLLIVAIVGAAYGAIDELTQPLVGRSCELLDWASDVSGIVLGSLAIAAMHKLVRSPRPA